MPAHRLLIVEDEPQARRLLELLFRHQGWEVVTAGTLEQALALLDPPPDCILLDLMLPDGHGEHLLAKVRETGLTAKVAVMTAATDPARIDAARRLKPNAILFKPLKVEDLRLACS